MRTYDACGAVVSFAERISGLFGSARIPFRLVGIVLLKPREPALTSSARPGYSCSERYRFPLSGSLRRDSN